MDDELGFVKDELLETPPTRPTTAGVQPIISPIERITLLPLVTTSPSPIAASEWTIETSRRDPDLLAYQNIKSILPYLQRHLVGDEIWTRIENLVDKYGSVHDLKQGQGRAIASSHFRRNRASSEETMKVTDQIHSVHSALLNMFEAHQKDMPWFRGLEAQI